MRGKVLVIGAGIAGITASLGLAQAGHEVFLLEREKEVGGKGRFYSCKAAELCQQCSACLIPKTRAKLEHNPNIHILPYSMLTDFHGSPGHYRANIRLLNEIRSDLGAETSLEVQAVVAATGFEIHNPAVQAELNYEIHKQVISAYELESILAEPSKLNEKLGGLRRIGIVLCVGSRDERAHSANYCSRYCCAYAQRLALRLSYLLPNTQLNIFYTELLTASSKEIESNQIKLIRSTPAKVYGYPANSLTVRFADSYTGSVSDDEYDLLILMPAQKPTNDLSLQFPQLGLSYDENGFYKDNNPDTDGNTGVFVAGSCSGPKNIPESIAHAKATVARVLQYLAQAH